jgi:hypothetical protein
MRRIWGTTDALLISASATEMPDAALASEIFTVAVGRNSNGSRP